MLTWTAVPAAASYFHEIERKQAALRGKSPKMVTTNSFLFTGLLRHDAVQIQGSVQIALAVVWRLDGLA
ncbi:MAG: hypothetical protein IPH31_23725 [Lewinellaceae bacterium]|nr:hypothetical protein [Lewinellaceae bacterium]